MHYNYFQDSAAAAIVNTIIKIIWLSEILSIPYATHHPLK